MLVLNNIACADDWSQAATLGPLPTGTNVSYLIANNSAFAQVYYSGQAQPSAAGDITFTPEILLGPSNGEYRQAKGMRFRNAVAGQTARVIAVLSQPHDPIGSAQAFTGTLAASGSITPQPGAVIAAARVRASAAQVVANATVTPIVFDVVDYDPAGFVSGNDLVVPTGYDGYYTIGVEAAWQVGGVAGTYRNLDLRVNNVVNISTSVVVYDPALGVRHEAVTSYQLAAGNIVNAVAFHNNGFLTSLQAAAAYSPVLWLIGTLA